MASERQAVIFDMDGVLVDSVRYIWEAFNEVVRPLGIKFDDAAIKKYLGNSLRDQIEMWKKDYGIDVGSVDNFSKKASDVETRLMGQKLKPGNDLIGFLEDLSKSGFVLGVGTSSVKGRAERLFSLLGFNKYFETLVTEEDVQNHKPHPEIFLEVASRLGVAPDDCVVFEDAESGVAAAKAGGMKVVALLTKWHAIEDFNQADLVIKNFKEINVSIIKKLLAA